MGFRIGFIYVALYLDRSTFGWQAVATTATMFMTLFIQRSEHRDTQANHAKLDELLRVHGDAQNRLANIALERAIQLAYVGSTLIGHCTMQLRCTALLILGLSLGGCCLSGSGCQVAASATGSDWDGLIPPPSENEAAASGARLRPKKEIMKGPVGAASAGPRLQSKDRWEQQQALDQAEEARLTRTLMICRNCEGLEPRRDDLTR
jgi:hypothetical protein